MIGKEYDLGEGKKVWWEMSERTTKKGPVDGAAVLAAFIDYESGQERIVLIANYRPPLDKFVIELPAGLVSPGEDPSIGAVRELKEETGYFARSEDVVSVTPVMHVDPWKSNEACVIVTVKLDMTLPENSNLT
jgi:ADP-ribose pyrophosphatase